MPRHLVLTVSRQCVQQTQRTHYGVWVVRVYGRGAAAVTFLSELLAGDPKNAPVRIDDVMSELPNAWTLAADALEAAGAAGEAFLGLHLESTLRPSVEGWHVTPTRTMDVARALLLGPPSPPELDSIRRELEREAGYPSFEPELEAP